jgi:hypothetical protein
MPSVASQAGIWTLQSWATSVNTLSVPVAGNRAGVRKGVADQDDAGLAIAG